MGSGFLPAKSAAPQTRESGDFIQISAANANLRALDIYSVKVPRGFVESCRFHNRTHLHMLVVQMDSKSWCEFRIVLMQASARGRVGFIRRYLHQDAYFWLLLRFSCLRRSCSSADFLPSDSLGYRRMQSFNSISPCFVFGFLSSAPWKLTMQVFVVLTVSGLLSSCAAASCIVNRVSA